MKIVWKSIPTVLFHDELLDKAYSRATKAADRVDDSHRVFRVRKQMNRMLQTASDVIAETLLEWVTDWPSLDKLPVFDEAMVEAAVGCDDYRHHLSMLQWGAKQVRNIAGQNQKKITRTANVEFMHESRREAYGRISSIVRQVGPSLAWLNDAKETLRNLPSIDAMEPCIVVAGAPNVGKSALINALSSGKPRVTLVGEPKAFLPSRAEEGTATDLRAGQSSKAYAPITSTEAEKVTDPRAAQVAKAHSSISLAETTTDLRARHWQKA